MCVRWRPAGLRSLLGGAIYRNRSLRRGGDRSSFLRQCFLSHGGSPLSFICLKDFQLWTNHFGDPFIETPRCLISWENWWFISEMAMNDVRQWLHCWITFMVVNPTSHWPVLLSCWGFGVFGAFGSLGRSPAQGDVLCVSGAIETDGDRASRAVALLRWAPSPVVVSVQTFRTVRGFPFWGGLDFCWAETT